MNSKNSSVFAVAIAAIMVIGAVITIIGIADNADAKRRGGDRTVVRDSPITTGNGGSGGNGGNSGPANGGSGGNGASGGNGGNGGCTASNACHNAG
jgi:hypothetical protein